MRVKFIKRIEKLVQGELTLWTTHVALQCLQESYAAAWAEPSAADANTTSKGLVPWAALAISVTRSKPGAELG